MAIAGSLPHIIRQEFNYNFFMANFYCGLTLNSLCEVSSGNECIPVSTPKNALNRFLSILHVEFVEENVSTTNFKPPPSYYPDGQYEQIPQESEQEENTATLPIEQQTALIIPSQPPPYAPEDTSINEQSSTNEQPSSSSSSSPSILRPFVSKKVLPPGYNQHTLDKKVHDLNNLPEQKCSSFLNIPIPQN